MYLIKNTGQFPIIIRDLSLHVRGGKTIDLDSVIKRATIEKSVDLQKLISSNKLIVVEKDGQTIEKSKPVTLQKKQNNESDNILLFDLKRDLLEIKSLLQGLPSGMVSIKKDSKEEHDEKTEQRIIDLKVRNLSKEDKSAYINFDDIGKVLQKKEEVTNLMDVLDSLENEK